MTRIYNKMVLLTFLIRVNQCDQCYLWQGFGAMQKALFEKRDPHGLQNA
jgi:hypothetical protein